jgi:hypothetical protein
VPESSPLRLMRQEEWFCFPELVGEDLPSAGVCLVTEWQRFPGIGQGNARHVRRMFLTQPRAGFGGSYPRGRGSFEGQANCFSIVARVSETETCLVPWKTKPRTRG